MTEHTRSIPYQLRGRSKVPRSRVLVAGLMSFALAGCGGSQAATDTLPTSNPVTPSSAAPAPSPVPAARVVLERITVSGFEQGNTEQFYLTGGNYDFKTTLGDCSYTLWLAHVDFVTYGFRGDTPYTTRFRVGDGGWGADIYHRRPVGTPQKARITGVQPGLFHIQAEIRPRFGCPFTVILEKFADAQSS